MGLPDEGRFESPYQMTCPICLMSIVNILLGFGQFCGDEFDVCVGDFRPRFLEHVDEVGDFSVGVGGEADVAGAGPGGGDESPAVFV